MLRCDVCNRKIKLKNTKTVEWKDKGHTFAPWLVCCRKQCETLCREMGEVFSEEDYSLNDLCLAN